MIKIKAYPFVASLTVFLAAACSASAAEPIRVLATGVFATTLQALAEPFGRATGDRIEIAIANAGAVTNRVAAGEAADLVMTSSAGIKTLVQQGALVANETVIGRMRLGVAVQQGKAIPDLASAEAVRTLLL